MMLFSRISAVLLSFLLCVSVFHSSVLVGAQSQDPPAELPSKLLEAVLQRDTEGILAALSSGEHIDTANVNGWTAASFAVADSSLEVLRVLIEQQIDLNIANNVGYTPLMIAALQSDKEAIEMLLAANADPTIATESGITAYSIAVDSKRLVNVGIILEALVVRGMVNNDPELVLDSIKKGAYVNIRTPTGWNPMIYACSSGNLELVKSLLTLGASADHVDNDGWGPLHFAAVNNHEDIVGVLLMAGANPNSQNTGGHTAKDLAEQQDLSSLVLTLEEAMTSGDL